MLFSEHFIDVILPIPLEKQFTYSITEEESDFLKKGMRVAVPFGKSKVYTAIVNAIHTQAPEAYEAKPIHQILDDKPIINEQQLLHWQWIAKYYMCSLGEVVKAALPSVFLLESETEVRKNIEFDAIEDLSDEEYLVYEALNVQATLSITQVAKILNKKNTFPVLKKMMEKGVLTIKEEIYEQYKPKLVHYVRLTQEWEAPEKLQELLEKLSRSEKQRTLVMTYFSMIGLDKKPVKQKELLEKSGISTAVLKALLDKEVFEKYQIQTDRISFDGNVIPIVDLNEFQQKAFEEIKESYSSKAVTLLHGVTGSGKTEVYTHIIKEVLDTGKQVLFLVPEIALTTQLIVRLQKYFGDKLSVYHSKYSMNERAEVWNNIYNKNAKAQIVLGTRSALLLPFSNLGLIVVDEEHEASYKQYDPAPRYHARDAAVVLAHQHKAKVLLGSATPSVETYYNAKSNKYGLVSLNRRHGAVQMPDIELIDIKEKHRKKRMTGHFSDRLLEQMKEELEEKKQIILFQNRRGYAPLIECKTCGTSPHCPNCDVSLTEHKFKRELRCHYCGYHRAIPQKCDACGSPDLDSKGFGTEQIEQELLQLFPNHKIGRLDLDTTRGKYGYAKIIGAFQERELDILVGTQMLSKGLDFDNVSLVGVLNADNMLNFPDFRAHERSYQMLSQVAGRAGRKGKQGKVLIQSFNPYHQILQQVTTNSYEQMCKEQLYDRKNFQYPPYFRMIKITLKHRNYVDVEAGADWLAKSMKNSFGKNVLGPTAPGVARVRNMYIQQINLKIPPTQHVEKTKAHLIKIKEMFLSIAKFRAIRINIDVDAY